MFNYLKDKYDLTKEGLQSLKKGVFYSVLANLSLMIPIGLMTLVLNKMLDKILKNNVDFKLSPVKYTVLGIGVLFIIFIFSYCKYTATYIGTYEESAKRRISIAEKMRELPLSFFGKRDLSDLTNTIMGDCASFEHAFSHSIPQFYGALISTLIIAIILLIKNWKMAIALFWVAPLSFLIILMSRRMQNKLGTKYALKRRALSDSIQECLELIEDIKAYNQEENYGDLIDKKLDEAEKAQKSSELLTASLITTGQMFLRLGLATVIVVGNTMVLNNETDLFTYILFLIAASMIYDPLSGAMNNLAEIFNVDILVERLKKIYSTQIQRGEKDLSFNNFNIRFENVSFSYAGEDKIIDNLSFTAKQGEKTALVGPSGSGKSTVLKLVARFWDIQKGKIYVGNKDISTIDAEDLLKYYSVVFQDVLLFDNSIMENIRLGRKGATDEEVIKAAKLANCDSFVDRLKEGYQTKIGEDGGLISGGERQRISIARAILKDAPIILLDEVTASLDVENETLIEEAISRVVKNKTVIIIAHRMRTIEGCNKIIVMDKGRVIEEGPHDKLIGNESLYNKLVTLQKQSEDWVL